MTHELAREIVSFTVPGEPIGMARARFSPNGGRPYTPRAAALAMDGIRLAATRAMGGREPIAGPVELSIRASYLYPKSWSERRRAATKWKSSRPDLSNIIKLAEDAMNGIVYMDDAQIIRLDCEKRYASLAGLTISVVEV